MILLATPMHITHKCISYAKKQAHCDTRLTMLDRVHTTEQTTLEVLLRVLTIVSLFRVSQVSAGTTRHASTRPQPGPE